MAYIEEHQYSFFEEPEQESEGRGPKPGEWVEEYGERLSFEQITQMVGEIIILDMSTEHCDCFMAVRVEKIVWNEGMRRLVYYTGSRQRGLVNEMYFHEDPEGKFPTRAYMPAGKRVPWPCDDCIFEKNGCCDHICDRDCFCVNGSFQITHESGKCPKCGHKMEIVQSDFGSDGGRCRKCGTNVIYNNRGNRKTAMELWRSGELVGD